MNPDPQQGILTIALLAAFADGANDERGREQIRRLAESLGGELGAAELPAIYQQVLLKRASLKDAAATLAEPEQRQLAYEMAVCVCDADGRQMGEERQFLADLALTLGLNSSVTEPANQQAEAMSELASTAVPLAVTTTAASVPAGAVVASVPNIPEAGIDRSVLNYAILNGALELLPQSWTSMAVIPMQIKMVYGIGKAHGYELDQGHIRELLAMLGVGLTAQYLEQFGRKLLGGLLGKAAGGLVKQFGMAATGVAFSLATTYALGDVAKRYYAGGRQMDSKLMQDSFRTCLVRKKRCRPSICPRSSKRPAVWIWARS